MVLLSTTVEVMPSAKPTSAASSRIQTLVRVPPPITRSPIAAPRSAVPDPLVVEWPPDRRSPDPPIAQWWVPPDPPMVRVPPIADRRPRLPDRRSPNGGCPPDPPMVSAPDRRSPDPSVGMPPIRRSASSRIQTLVGVPMVCDIDDSRVGMGRDEPDVSAARPRALPIWMALRTVCSLQGMVQAMVGVVWPSVLATSMWSPASSAAGFSASRGSQRAVRT